MNSNLEKSSLVHYLKPTDAKFYLEIPMTGNRSLDHQRPRFPFVIVSATDPLALTLKATIFSDAGTKIKSVFLLTQKDEYHLIKNEIWPVSNRDIDFAWQHFFTFLNDQNQNDSIIILQDQVGDDGKLLPWSPLFYCQHRQIFFQPPCPQCGSPLDLSRDDNRLTSSGLQPYSTSLKRYLYCPQCLEAHGESEYYVPSLSVSDPDFIKDQHGLIRGFGQLARNVNQHANIPCFECDSLPQCYETDHLSTTRIVSFSFYPFYMIALPAPSIHFLDFLPLLAGADVKELENRILPTEEEGRVKCLKNFEQKISHKTLFFFDKDEKLFLEVLYLKLSLLGELAQIVFSGLNTFKYPDLGLSVGRIWASMAQQSGMLPLYWNFKLNLLGIGVDSAKTPSLSKLPPSYGLYSLGAIWFYVLLVNTKQDVSAIHPEIARVIEHAGLEESGVFECVLKNYPSAVFSPENIFWDPDQKSVNQGWETFWTRSLDLGFLLLQHSMSQKSLWSETEFWQRFEALRDTIKEALFSSEASFADTSPVEDDDAIHEILMKITSKWRDDFMTRAPVPEAGADVFLADEPAVAKADAGLSEDIVTEETVILSPEDFKAEEPTVFISAEKLEETVLLKLEDVEKPGTSAPVSKISKDLPETVILTHVVSDTQKPSPKEPPESDIPETVIISSQDPAASQIDSDRKRLAGDDSTETKKQDLSRETKGRRAEKKPTNIKDEDDDLPETVILDPKKPKNKH